MTSAKHEVETLMNDLVPFAKKMLAEHGEFHPFGGFMKEDGSIVHVGATHPSTDKPKASDLLGHMAEDLKRRARTEGIKATALIFDVRVMDPTERRKTNAIQATLEHADSYSAEVFFPYRVNDKGILEFGKIFAQHGEPSIFPSS